MLFVSKICWRKTAHFRNTHTRRPCGSTDTYAQC